MGDLDCFLRAAWAVRSGADLYTVTDDNGFHYNYPPLLAILATPLADPPHKDLSVSAARTVSLLGACGGGPLLAVSAQAADETPLLPDSPPTIPFIPFALSVAIVYLVNLSCLAFAVHMLAAVLEPAPVSRFRWYAFRVWPILACMIPIGHTLMRGQANFLVLALVTAGLAATLRGRNFQAGLWLAGAACLKIFPAFLFLFPLWRRDRRCMAGGAVGFLLGLVVIPLAALGPARTWQCYARLGNVLVLPALGADGDQSRAEELTKVNGAADNQSLLCVLHNTFHRDRATRPQQASSGERLASYFLGGLLTLLTLASGRLAAQSRTGGRRAVVEPAHPRHAAALSRMPPALLCADAAADRGPPRRTLAASGGRSCSRRGVDGAGPVQHRGESDTPPTARRRAARGRSGHIGGAVVVGGRCDRPLPAAPGLSPSRKRQRRIVRR